MANHRLLQGIAVIDVAKSFDELNRSAYSKKYVDQEESVAYSKSLKGHPMQKIVPHLWFDKEAKEAAEFYTSTFPDSKLTNITTIHDTPSGDCDVVSFELWGYSFMAISAGPLFTFNPSVSFMVNFDPSQDKDAEDADR